MNTVRTLPNLLKDMITAIQSDHITISELTTILHERGFGLLIFIFALPMALPIPVPPGVNVAMATPLLFLTAQQAIGAKFPWFPRFIAQKTLSKNTLESTVEASIPWLNRLNTLLKPRLYFMTQGLFSHIIGVAGFLFALCVCVPIPMTNTIPSLAIACMAIGVLMRDGLVILAGMIIGTGWITLLATLGITGLKALINLII